MDTEIDVHAYVQDLEKHLQLSLFGGGTADPEGAVLLVRGALAEGDQRKAADLAESTQRLATTTPGNRDMAAAADHARGLVEQNPATLERAAVSYSAALTRARALEDAGNAWAEQGDQDNAVALLRQAHTLYERLAAADGMARVRHSMRAAGTRLCHWSHADRPAFGWDSLTDTERRIADLVAQGLSNRQVASRVFLSPHTVAFTCATSSGSSTSARGCISREWPPRRPPRPPAFTWRVYRSGYRDGTGVHLEAKTVALLLTLPDGGARLVSTGNLNTTQPDAVAIDVDPRSADFARSAEVAAGPRWKPRPDPPSANEWLAACHGSVRLMPG